jgi:hypothetical protein
LLRESVGWSLDGWPGEATLKGKIIRGGYSWMLLGENFIRTDGEWPELIVPVRFLGSLDDRQKQIPPLCCGMTNKRAKAKGKDKRQRQ